VSYSIFHNFPRRVGRIEHQAAYDTYGSTYQSEQMAWKLNGLVHVRQRWVGGFGDAVITATVGLILVPNSSHSREKSPSTLYRKSWVFLRVLGFPPTEKVDRVGLRLAP
jgi:hypothetical protein